MAKATKEKTVPPVMEEIGALTAGDASTLEKLMDPPDTVLKQRGGDFKVYDDIKRDDQVKTCIEQRRRALVAAEWEVDAGAEDAASQMAADDLREQLKEISFDSASEKMWNSVFYGYGVAEMMWGTDGSRIVMQGIKVRKQRRFKFDGAGRLRLLDATGQGKLLPDRKFWVIRSGADDDDELYGTGLGHWLYWPVFFKRQGIAFWMTFLDKIGSPTAWGKHPPNASQQEKEKLLAALAAIRRNSSIITPDGVVLELLEAKRSSTPDYATLIDKMDSAISKITVGQTMTVDDGSSRSQGEVHADVKADIVKADADLLCESFNAGPARWLTEWNHPNAVPPRVFRRTEEPEDLTSLADRDVKLSQIGYRPTAERVAEVYGDGYEPVQAQPTAIVPGGDPVADPEAELAAAAPAQTTQPGGSATDFADLPEANQGDDGIKPGTGGEIVDALAVDLRKEAAPAAETAMQRAEALLNDCSSLQEFADRLVEIYPGAPDAELAELMQAALSLAELQGRADLQERPAT
ncbi:DUF935 domain-containing protein [Ferrovibrio sp.]|uniref:DUF935 domain-containing protein n=1 Tax=Ferrovibrio sp. TaxID=1917215 RepID=UPI0035AE0808